jgi:hypothetical protein
MATTVIYAGEETHYPIDLVGASATTRCDPAVGEGLPFRVGTMTWGTLGSKWVFVGPAASNLVGAATPANGVALAVSNTTFVPSAGTGYKAYAPILSGQYGWVEALDVA